METRANLNVDTNQANVRPVEGSVSTAADTTAVGMVRGLGLLDSTMMVMGSMIGSGIFIVSADIARLVEYPSMLLAVWLLTAVITVMGALSYGELAAAMPRVGGQYVYLKEAYTPMVGFLYGWTLFAVIQTGFIAAVAVAFSRYAGVYFPWIAESNIILRFGALHVATTQLVAILSIVALTYLNSRGLRLGVLVQNTFTFAKVSAVVALMLGGLLVSRAALPPPSETAFFPPTFDLAMTVALGAAMVGSLFSSDAWNNITFTAGEIRDPRRVLPLSLVLGTATVSLLYVMTNVAYLRVLGIEQIAAAPEGRVGASAAFAMLGTPGLTLVTAAILISTLGCNNGLVLAGARVYYAMARDGVFFRRIAELNPTTRVPTASLWAQCLWASILTLTGTFTQLLDYSVFAALLFYVLTVIGLFVLRAKRPDLERPYKALGYPVLPALYILGASSIAAIWLFTKDGSWWGMVMVLTGFPVYLIWKRRQSFSESTI
jgi:APA family basic amino acid/polyamine antiporter